MVSVINGIIWRDTNGDGLPQNNEERLQAKVFGIKIMMGSTILPLSLHLKQMSPVNLLSSGYLPLIEFYILIQNCQIEINQR